MDGPRPLPPKRGDPPTDFFVPHPNLDDAINRNICLSEIEGGVHLKDLRVGALVEVETKNRFYMIENRGNGEVLICGHPQFCPRPVQVKLHGSTWGNSMLKLRYIGRGMHLEFRHPSYGVICTSPVQEIRQLQQ
jgi:hypothetical protein